MHGQVAVPGRSNGSSLSHALVIFTRVDGALRDRDEPCESAQSALSVLAAEGVPVVLVSDENAARVLEVQRELGVSGPFLCNGGRNLYIPRGYFEELDGLSAGDEQWEVFHFPADDIARGVNLLTSLFSVRCAELVTIGLGCDWADRSLLAAVNVPVVVRTGTDQTRLLQHLPHAYLTTAAGGHGWSEAVLGSAAI